LVEPCLEEASFEELCNDIVMGSTTSSIGLIDPIRTKPLDLTPFHPLFSYHPLSFA